MTKVAIVGGGPAGSATALNLLAAGVDPGDIAIFDRATFPRPKLCGGALTWRGTEALRELIGEQPDLGGETRALEFRCSLGAFPVRERGAQWLYDRAHLDHLLLQRCIDAGVTVHQKTPIKAVQIDGDRAALVTAKTIRTYDWVVGADGARGVVARSLALGGGIVGRLVEAVYRTEGSRHERDRLYFDFDPIVDGIPGYAWIFQYPKPHTEGLWKIGIMDGRGVTPGKALRAWTDRYAERNGFTRVDEKIAGWPEHYYSPKTRAHRPGVILVGEAWGIDPLLGEGIAPALYMARYAAGKLKAALDVGVPTIGGYERDFRRTDEGRNLNFQRHLANLLYGKGAHRWLRVLFGHEYMKQLAASGEEAYGRLEKHTWKLIRSYAGQALRRGFPSNAPIRATEQEQGA